MGAGNTSRGGCQNFSRDVCLQIWHISHSPSPRGVGTWCFIYCIVVHVCSHLVYFLYFIYGSPVLTIFANSYSRLQMLCISILLTLQFILIEYIYIYISQVKKNYIAYCCLLCTVHQWTFCYNSLFNQGWLDRSWFVQKNACCVIVSLYSLTKAMLLKHVRVSCQTWNMS